MWAMVNRKALLRLGIVNSFIIRVAQLSSINVRESAQCNKALLVAYSVSYNVRATTNGIGVRGKTVTTTIVIIVFTAALTIRLKSCVNVTLFNGRSMTIIVTTDYPGRLRLKRNVRHKANSVVTTASKVNSNFFRLGPSSTPKHRRKGRTGVVSRATLSKCSYRPWIRIGHKPDGDRR